ncbi:MAG: IS66 family insertion sequence element accessory protein TnpB [Flavobacterium sp.]|uniref:IS66 family insertion sequence element accessory protein TnpB n=1 Tax=Flavobacterium sp. TaxID=239 RepID=UPI003266C047
MLSISSSQRYFFYSGLTDMRKGFDSLCGLVRSEFKMNPLSGDVFIFLSRTKNKIKLLQWQRDGFAIYYKRLERGAFELPLNDEGSAGIISSQQLMLIMEGIKLSSVKKHKRYEQIVV